MSLQPPRSTHTYTLFPYTTLVRSPLHLVGQFGPIAGTGGLSHDMLQPALRLPAFGHRLMRIFIAQIVKREADAGEEAGGFGNRLRAVAEQAVHLGGWFQVAFGIGGQPSPRLRDAGLFTDAGEDVVQRTLGRRCGEGIGGRNQRHAQFSAQSPQPGKPATIYHADWKRSGWENGWACSEELGE